MLYANIDGFSPSSLSNPGQLSRENLADGDGYRPVSDRGELDRWVLSELHQTLDAVVTRMDAYDNYGACSQITAFVDALSNWYVRRSRDRFWAKDKQAPEKLDAYWTLYECLITTAKMVAPFVPFVAETIWQNLTGIFDGKSTESVHLCDYPLADPSDTENCLIDPVLSRQMGLLREIASLGLSARMQTKLRVRQPLSGVTVILNDQIDQAWLEAHDEFLKTELNVQNVTYTTDAGEYVTYQIVPNFKRLGPRVGKLMPKVKQAFAEADGAAILTELTANKTANLKVENGSIELTDEDVEVRLQANKGWAAAQGSQAVIVLSTELTPELIRAGLARDVNRMVQDRRKELDLERTDRIELAIETESEELRQAITENLEYLKGETLATNVSFDAPSNHSEFSESEIGEFRLKIFIQIVEND